MEYLVLEETDSTNSYISRNFATMPDKTMVRCRKQTAGRGQRGNSWESEEGKNLTFSVLYFPDRFPAHSQFSISETVALAIVETLFESGIDAEVKWPNDIYVADRKICGILIENTLSGAMLSRAVAGMGINVNQTRFVSDAPNPVSMAMIAGREFDVEEIAAEVAAEVMRLMPLTSSEEGREALGSDYRVMLWRRRGMHPYRDTASGQCFMASIESIGEMGHLTLRDAAGHLRTFAFKEVEALLPQ